MSETADLPYSPLPAAVVAAPARYLSSAPGGPTDRPPDPTRAEARGRV